jgi:hypothetical protein
MDGCAMGVAADALEPGGLAFLPHPVNNNDTVRTALSIIIAFIMRTAFVFAVFKKSGAS